MITAGFAWATANGLVRKNPIHQEEEAKLIISETFELQDQTGTEINLSGSFEAEDESGFLLQQDAPSIESSLAEIARGTSDAAPEEAPTAGQAASFKLVFPTLAQNASATSLLASFLEVLGRKIDACEDKLEEVQNSRAASLRDQMIVIMKDMKSKYDDLTAKQAESVTTTPDKAFNDDLLRKYAEITKQDVVLGNYVIRARSMTKKGGSSSKAPSVAGAAKGKPKDKKIKKEEGQTWDLFRFAADGPSGSEFDDDLADELFTGFEQGAESARRVTRLASVANNKLKKHGLLDPVLSLLAGCGQNKKNQCRNLHKLVHKQGYTIPIKIDSVETPVRVLSGKPRVAVVPYPVIHLSEWAGYLLNSKGYEKALLAGNRLADEKNWRHTFSSFWKRYRKVRPHLELFSDSDIDLSMCIPYGLHGDEGRGKLKRPIMCLSFQHSFTTRLLYSVIPSELYVGDRTLDTLHAAMTEDLLQLYHDGITVAWLGAASFEWECRSFSSIYYT
ncbi:unnamed protein product [Symbiodinium sp. CCMP2456]|nr:unnamed protein product [Symbiodinium sp. CCMP2456]